MGRRETAMAWGPAGGREQETADQALVCVLCRRGFTFTVGEQVFYESRGLRAPRRCPACRARRKREAASA